MTGRGILFALSVATTALVGAPVRAQEPPANPPTAQFKSSVDLVSVAAIVRDRKGRFVSDLSQADFQVVEAGETRRILDFHARADGPVKVAVLFDISGSMRLGSKVADAKQAARHVFGALKSGDEAAVFSFDTRLQRVRGFTQDVATLEAAIEKVEEPFGQTSLYDAIADTARAAATEGRGASRVPQRLAVVVLTDGVDTRSQLTPSQVTAIASEIDVPVYIITVLPPMAEGDDDALTTEAVPETALESLARYTGGQLFNTSAPAHASIAARQIVSELRHQYVLAFESSTRAGWRPLEVRARGRNLVVRARSGYMAGAGGPASETARRQSF
ncbi:MAG: VWA domain-containing protein [Acidobacteria bacterium]|nr:VWA domain-containing protein [Acidobacteriota bacterium]MCA1649351.1 VWA domain-containing protein [Acidobacteriota bacterium]